MSCSAASHSSTSAQVDANVVDIENLGTSAKTIPKLRRAYDMDKYRMIIEEMLERDFNTEEEIEKFKLEMRIKHKLIVSNMDALHAYREYCKLHPNKYHMKYEVLLQSHKYRGDAGVLPVATFTSPYPMTQEQKDYLGDNYEKIKSDMENNHKFTCEFDCWFCPAEPGKPRSYGFNEPGVLRALNNDFDAARQFWERLGSLDAMGLGHTKVEWLLLGGTFSSYKDDYQEEFIRDTYYAANTYSDPNRTSNPRKRLSLEEEMHINERCDTRIIGFTIETRPDKITSKEIKKLRRFGVTRVQMGIQHINDRVLSRINRMCTNKQVINAIKLLKNNNFKIDAHFMPDLPQPFTKEFENEYKFGKEVESKYIKFIVFANILVTLINSMLPNFMQMNYINEYDIVKRKKEDYTGDDIDFNFDMLRADEEMLDSIIHEPEYQVDQIKMYPCSTVPHTRIESDYKKGWYIPYADQQKKSDWSDMEKSLADYKGEADWDNLVSVFRKYHEEGRWQEFVSLLEGFKNGKYWNILMSVLLKNKSSSDLSEMFTEIKKYTDRKYWTVLTNILNKYKRNKDWTPLVPLLMNYKDKVQPWVRLNRVIRDIPEGVIMGGNTDVNIRQKLEIEMKKLGMRCKCIRCREVKNKKIDPSTAVMKIREYDASDGKEYFISFETEDELTIFGFIRLRISDMAGKDNNGRVIFPELIDAAMIRELHVYGQVVKLGDDGVGIDGSKLTQHYGFGTKLVNKAFTIAKEHGYNKVSVIPGVGVKEYYANKFGFATEGSFMTTLLN
jgi:histone acetyltransferase (RNA polymerase elongator complex component)